MTLVNNQTTDVPIHMESLTLEYHRERCLWGMKIFKLKDNKVTGIFYDDIHLPTILCPNGDIKVVFPPQTQPITGDVPLHTAYGVTLYVPDLGGHFQYGTPFHTEVKLGTMEPDEIFTVAAVPLSEIQFASFEDFIARYCYILAPHRFISSSYVTSSTLTKEQKAELLETYTELYEKFNQTCNPEG